jgi:predicted ribosomally synthesized peptide with SipW-like signal peptide
LGETLGFALRLTEENKAEVIEKEVKKMKGAKIGAIFLVVIMSLVGVGVSYSAWSQSVDIQGSVGTGTFEFKITNIAVNLENGATITPSYINDHTWSVTITHTYPGWKGYITVTHQNAGTVPLKFNTFQILNLVGDTDLQNGYTLKFYPDAYPPIQPANIAGTLYNFQTLQYYDSWVGPYEIKLMAGDTHSSCVSLELDPALTDHYGATVTFIFEMTAIQTIP